MDPAAVAAVAETHRRDWGFVLAATARIGARLGLPASTVHAVLARYRCPPLAGGCPGLRHGVSVEIGELASA